ncbi:hypothetical protein AArcCO_4027 (plasmid) [Halalkaliarchaeum sp. AArc-CO]|nr:hypothetical protein AArcCO_4027 [Halalkaliarchaeum sp. AArc-CO]
MDGGGHELTNLITLCSICHEETHGHPIFPTENSSQESSDLNIFSLGIQNLWSDSANSTDNNADTSEFYEWDENESKPEEKSTFAGMFIIGIFLTPALFIFTSIFWIALFDGESFLFALGALAIFLVFLGIPLLFAAVIGGMIPTVIVYSVLDFFLVEGELGRELSDIEAACYLLVSLSMPTLFNISLFRSVSTETTLIQALWPATRSAIIGCLVLLILTTVFLFLRWVVITPVDTE